MAMGLPSRSRYCFGIDACKAQHTALQLRVSACEFNIMAMPHLHALASATCQQHYTDCPLWHMPSILRSIMIMIIEVL